MFIVDETNPRNEVVNMDLVFTIYKSFGTRGDGVKFYSVHFKSTGGQEATWSYDKEEDRDIIFVRIIDMTDRQSPDGRSKR